MFKAITVTCKYCRSQSYVEDNYTAYGTDVVNASGTEK